MLASLPKIFEARPIRLSISGWNAQASGYHCQDMWSGLWTLQRDLVIALELVLPHGLSSGFWFSTSRYSDPSYVQHRSVVINTCRLRTAKQEVEQNEWLTAKINNHYKLRVIAAIGAMIILLRRHAYTLFHIITANQCLRFSSKQLHENLLHSN